MHSLIFIYREELLMKFYTVRKGRKTGIFTTWSECEAQVKGFPQAEYKSFTQRTDAENYLQGNQNLDKKEMILTQQEGWKTPDILLFTDGGSRNHGNQAGDHVHADDKAAWAFLIHRNGHNVRGTGGEYGATNNRMELMALRNALKVLGQRGWNHEKINAVLDSRYVLQAIQKNWLQSWKKNGWCKSSGEEIANRKLWEEIEYLLSFFTQIKFSWTKGHANNKGNVIVDQMLNRKMDQM